jgi:phage antirepressor YoqD-like protein
MNDLSLHDNFKVVTMTSREIAELTGKQHQHVLFDIRKMLAELGEDESSFRRIYLDSMNRRQTEYVLDRELTETLLTGYSAILRRKVIARWRELEAQQAPAVPTTLSAALRLAADQADQIERQQAQLAIAEPKAEALDRIANADGSMCITDAAKHLQVPPKHLFTWLSTNDWIYRRPGNAHWIAYQPRLKSLLLEHKVTTVDRGNGTEKVVEQVLVTAKGLAKLAQALAQNKS